MFGKALPKALKDDPKTAMDMITGGKRIPQLEATAGLLSNTLGSESPCSCR